VGLEFRKEASSLDRLPQTSEQTPSASNGIFDRQEHTATGFVIGAVRDAFGAPTTREAREQQAQTNDEWAKIAADVVASMPRFRAASAGLIRVRCSSIRTESLRDNALNFAVNTAEGAALNSVVRTTSAEGFVGKWTSTKLGGGLKSEISNHLIAGAGFSAVKNRLRRS